MERARLSLVFLPMTISLSQLLEDSFQIAWEYLERTGELGDGAPTAPGHALASKSCFQIRACISRSSPARVITRTGHAQFTND
jgi:hypothetical protein